MLVLDNRSINYIERQCRRPTRPTRMVTSTMPSLLDKEDSYTSTEDGKYVTYRAGGKPGKRLIRNPGDPGWSDEAFTRIPVIDFTNVDDPDPEVRKALARELGDAAEHVGFWYAANTPVTRELSRQLCPTNLLSILLMASG